MATNMMLVRFPIDGKETVYMLTLKKPEEHGVKFYPSRDEHVGLK